MASPDPRLGSPFAGDFDQAAWLASPSRELTLRSWDERAPAHRRSVDYGVDTLISDPAALSGVVRFDLPLLGRIAGQRGVHLQCHIGTDTISLARLGADMAGLDYSQAAVSVARDIARSCGLSVPFHHADLYDAPAVLGEQAWDLVFTGIGALCWLPDIDRWAGVVASLLRPGGRLFLREGHPMLWSLADPGPNGELLVEHAYFQRPEPTVWDEEGTYVATDEKFQHNVTHEWNHGIGEVVTALLRHGMVVTGLVEHDSVPWDALPGWMTRDDAGEYRLVDRPWRLPLSYTLQALKR